MLQTLIITLREGVEAALVIGIAVVYLRKTGRENLFRIVYLALGAAVAASIAAALILERITINREAFEGWVLLLAAFFVATMVYWMNRTSRGLRHHIEKRLEYISSQKSASVPGVFLFVFLMVFREGVETALLLGAVSFNTADLLDFSGAAFGLALAVIFGILFVRGSNRLDLRKFFKVTTFILLCVVAQLTISGLHELSEAGVLPSSQTEMAMIGPIVSNDIFFFITILALAALMILFDWRHRRSPAPLPEDATSAEKRRQAWAAQRERWWMTAVCGSAFVFIIMVTAEFIYAKGQSALSPSTTVQSVGGEIRIPTATVSDGGLHRFVAQSGDTSTRFLVLYVSDRYATAFDACVICGAQGYYQRGPEIFCRNCSAGIFPPTIGITGGCNPIPLPSRVEGPDLVIQIADLEPGASYF